MLKWTLGLGLALLLLGLGVVNLLAEPAGAEPAPDPGMLISLPDGGQRRLDELLAAARHAAGREGAGQAAADHGNFAETGVAPDAVPMPDGSAAGPAGAAGPGAAGSDTTGVAAPATGEREYAALSPGMRIYGARWRTEPNPDDPYELGEYHLWTTGELAQAEALFRSVPEDHPHYNVAMRRIGWEILTKERGDPRAGVAYINRSLAADPFDHDIWQDTWRVYARTLGMEVP
jgi:hypothetical protein